MDRNGTATALLSFQIPGFLEYGDVDAVRTGARICNESAAKLRADYPGRFGSFASLPLWYGDIDGPHREIEYALGTLQADGFGVYSNYGDKWLGDASFAPVWEELNRRKAIVYVHPKPANCCSGLIKGIPDTVVEYGEDTTRTIASLLYTGTTLRFPDIVWIFSHSGGMMPYIIERFFQGGASAEIVPGVVTKGQVGPTMKNVPTGGDVLRELRKMYYDTAQTTNPIAMRALKDVVPTTQIVYGTDFWFRTAAETSKGLISNKVFTNGELRMINRGNAERLLPRLKAI